MSTYWCKIGFLSCEPTRTFNMVPPVGQASPAFRERPVAQEPSSNPTQAAAGNNPLSAQLNQSAGAYELVLSAVFLGFIGYWVDGWLGTRPLFTIALAVLGLFGAGLSMFYRYKHQIAELNAQTALLREQARNNTQNTTRVTGSDR